MPPYTEQQRAYWMSAFACGPPVDTRFTITSGIAGQGYWYNRRSGSMVGSAVGDLSIPGLNDINRFGINAPETCSSTRAAGDRSRIGSWRTLGSSSG